MMRIQSRQLLGIIKEMSKHIYSVKDINAPGVGKNPINHGLQGEEK